MTKEVTINNIYCSVTVNTDSLDKNIKWQEYLVTFWTSMFDAAPNSLHRIKYSVRLIEEQTCLEAMNLLKLRLKETFGNDTNS